MSYPLTFLLTIVLARSLGPSDYGVYTGIMAIVGILGLVSSFGLEAVSSISLPKIDPEVNTKAASYFIKRLLVTRTTTTLLALPILFLNPGSLLGLFSGQRASNEWGIFKLLLAIYFLLSNVNLLLQSFYRGLLRFKSLSLIDTVTYSLNLILCFFLFKFTNSLAILFAALTLTQFLSTAFLISGLKGFLFQASEKIDFRDTNLLMVNLYGTRLVQYGIGYQKDILLIGYFHHNPMLLGLYAISTKITEAFDNVLTLGFGEVALPSFSETFLRKGQKGLKEIWHVFMRLEMFLTIPCLTFAIINARAIISFLYSDQYLQAVPTMQLFAALILIGDGFLGGGTSQKVLYAMNKQNLAFLIMFSSGILNVVLGLILIPRFDVFGAVLATGISMIAWRLSELVSGVRLIKADFPFAFFLKVIIGALAALYLCTFIKVTGLMALLFSGVVFLSFFLFVMYILKPFCYEDWKRLSTFNFRLGKLFSYFCRD